MLHLNQLMSCDCSSHTLIVTMLFIPSLSHLLDPHLIKNVNIIERVASTIICFFHWTLERHHCPLWVFQLLMHLKPTSCLILQNDPDSIFIKDFVRKKCEFLVLIHGKYALFWALCNTDWHYEHFWSHLCLLSHFKAAVITVTFKLVLEVGHH